LSRSSLSKEQKDINPDPAYWDHFDQWWEKDFSWDGLATHKIENHPDDRTLQDYWREEENHLIEFARKKWTRFHLPPHDKDGNTNEKWGVVNESDWQHIKWQNWQMGILIKLQYAIGSTSQAQLQGICFPNNFDFSSELEINETSKQQKQDRTLHINATWARFGNETNFNDVTLGDRAAFDGASFGDRTSFDDARFGDEASFTDALFGQGVTFNHAVFGIYTGFEHAVFGHETRFWHTTFGKVTSFHATKFGQLTKLIESKFNGYVNFVDAEFEAGLSFKQAEFKELAKFHNCKFHSDSSFADAEFAIPVLKIGLLDDIWITWHLRQKSKEKEQDTKEFHIKEQAEPYESAFRILRQHMENLRNYGQAMKFARLETKARERRYGSPDVPLLVRSLSRGYGFISDYGQSILKPLTGLILAVPVAALLYNWIGGDDGNLRSSFLMAMQSSLPPVSNAIAGFFGDFADTAMLNALDAQPFLTRIIMTLHGLFSIAMVFFLLLAIRRQFQLR